MSNLPMEFSDAGSTSSPTAADPLDPTRPTATAIPAAAEYDLDAEDVDFELDQIDPEVQQTPLTTSPLQSRVAVQPGAELKPLRGREDPSTSTDGSVAQPSPKSLRDATHLAQSLPSSHTLGLAPMDGCNDSVTTYEDDADIAVQMAFRREPADAHIPEGALLAALERTVNETIAHLDAGRDYEQTELTEAIVKRRLQKQSGVVGGLVVGGADGGDEAMARRLADERLPPLIGPIDGLYPGGDFSFETDSDAGEDFYRPASTNASGGIRPYRPGETIVTSPRAPPPEVPPAVATARFTAIQAACRAALWQGYRSGRPYLYWSLVVPLLYALGIALIFRFAGGQVCGGLCQCSIDDHVQYLFTYGWATRVVPTAIFFTYLLHVIVYAQQRQVLESGGAAASEAGERASGARAMMALSRRRQNQRDNVASKKHVRREALATLRAATKRFHNDNCKKPTADANADGRGANGSSMVVVACPTDVGQQIRGNGMQQPPTTTTTSIPWDVPSFSFCVQQRSFAIVAASMVVLGSAAQFSPLMGLPVLTIVPIEAAALVLPTIAGCFYFRVPQAVYPIVLLEVLPMVAYFVEPRMALSYQVFHCVWPFVVCAMERVFFYVFFLVAPPSLPVGARIAATTMIGFTSHVLILTAAMFLSPVASPSILAAICVQVFLYELLLGTVILDRIGIYLKAQWHFRRHGSKIQPPCMETTDLRCVGTQTRWCSQLMASVSLGVVWAWRRWPRSIEGGLACGTGLLEERSVRGGAVAACFGAFAVAALLTAMIRRRNGCLRAPLMVRGRGFPLAMSIYLFMSGFTLAAGAYQGPSV